MHTTHTDHRTYAICCPRCATRISWAPTDPLVCPGCHYAPAGRGRYVDFLEDAPANTTDEHYTYQWGKGKGFYRFFKQNPGIRKIMPAGQMGWPALFSTIRSNAGGAADGPIRVYDAACGFGGIASELVNETTTAGINYIGADIHHSLPDLLAEQPLLNECAVLMRWDIAKPVPMADPFDYVICRAAIHHTPEPESTFRSLAQAVKPGGQLAITAYRKKGKAREALDDTFRNLIAGMPVREAYELCRQFTMLGMYLQQVREEVAVEEDLDVFEIRKGKYSVQTLFYNHFLKCFFNSAFGEDYSTLVNFDWYHPTYAYRYDLPDLVDWFEANNLRVIETQAIEAQYYVLGQKAA